MQRVQIFREVYVPYGSVQRHQSERFSDVLRQRFFYGVVQRCQGVVDDFPDDDEQEDAPTEDDVFQEQTDTLEELTDEEKFESVCGLSPKDVKAILSLKYSEDELNKKSLEELSQLYLQEV